MGLFDSWLLQAILFEDALNSLERLDKEDSDSDMQEITHCSDCANWKKSESANNVGECTLRGETMFSGDFCSRAEKKQKIKLTENEMVFAKALRSIGFDTVIYNYATDQYAIFEHAFCRYSKDLPFPTLKSIEEIGQSKTTVRLDLEDFSIRSNGY